MIIRHSLPKIRWTKIDRNVFTLEMSAGSKVLYGYLCGLRNGAAYTDINLIRELRISQTTLTKQKRELKNQLLLLTEQVLPRVFVAYIGHTEKTAQEVKDEWKEEDSIV
jgi:hypothetical protein